MTWLMQTISGSSFCVLAACRTCITMFTHSTCPSALSMRTVIMQPISWLERITERRQKQHREWKRGPKLDLVGRTHKVETDAVSTGIRDLPGNWLPIVVNSYIGHKNSCFFFLSLPSSFFFLLLLLLSLFNSPVIVKISSSRQVSKILIDGKAPRRKTPPTSRLRRKMLTRIIPLAAEYWATLRLTLKHSVQDQVHWYNSYIKLETECR